LSIEGFWHCKKLSRKVEHRILKSTPPGHEMPEILDITSRWSYTYKCKQSATERKQLPAHARERESTTKKTNPPKIQKTATTTAKTHAPSSPTWVVATLLEPPDLPLRGEVWGPRDVTKLGGGDGTDELELHNFWVSRSEFQHSDTALPDWSVVALLAVWAEETRFVSLEDDVMVDKNLLRVVENVVAGAVLAGAEEGNPERDEDVTGVVVVTAGETSTGADKPLAENMLRVLVVVTVMVTTWISVQIGGG
jgi:hypothetical protein